MAAKLATVDECILAHVEEVIGMQFECGYLSPYFVTDPARMEVTFEDVYVLIHQGKIISKQQLAPLLEQITECGKPLLIIAEDIGDEALATLVVNKLRGSLQVAAVKAPGFGDERKGMLGDIARITGGKTTADDLGLQLKNVRISDLGQATKITVDKNNTMVEGKFQVRLESRVNRSESRSTRPERAENIRHAEVA